MDAANVNIMVLGEHGDSQCVAWSRSKVLGMSIDEYLSMDVGGESEVDHSFFAQNVKASAMKIIENKGFTAQGVAICVERVVRAIVTNSHEILPLSVVLEGEYGLKDVALSVPCQIGREGLLEIKQVLLSKEEKKKLDESAAILKKMASDSGMI